MGNSTTSPVFWSQIERFQSNSYSDDGVPDSNWLIQDKITSVFSKIHASNLKGLIQFWAPIKTKSGKLVLTTCDQPFTLKHVSNYSEHRVYCKTYQYSIDQGFNNNKVENAVISGGPLGTVFLNQLPEVVLDLRRRQVHPGESPLIQHALECDLTSYFMLPVFYPTSSSCCVGVVECCMELSCFLKIFREVKRALKNVGLSTFNVLECRPYKSMPALKRVTDEIEEALVIVCESHDLPAAQVWIPYENENYLPFEPCAADGTQTKGRFAVKLVGYCVDSDDRLCKSYYDTCDTLPLKIEEGLVGKTLETYHPHFCTNIYDMGRYERSRDKTLLAFLSATTRCSCFVICMRSIDTGDINYAFEFLWPQTRNYLILLESMLLTLKRCLPHFKLASGARLGDELRIIDVENSTGSGGIGSFAILQGNKLSQIPKALEERRRFLVPEDCISSSSSLAVTHLISLPREDVIRQLGRSTNETARNLTGWWQRPNFVKRKRDVYESDCDSNEEVNNKSANQDDGISIKLECARGLFKFYQRNSLTLAILKKEIHKRCNLNPGTYKLKYLDHDQDWILMSSDKHLRQCISNPTFVNGAHIRLRVLPLNQL